MAMEVVDNSSRVYRLPRAIDLNAASRLLKGKEALLLLGRCVEIEKPWALKQLLEKKDYAILSICLEEHHVNHVGFKIAGIIARLGFREVAVLTTDGSMHCVQLHYMLEEIEKIMGKRFERKHYVALRDHVEEIPPEAVKASRYLSKVKQLLARA